MAPVMPGGRGPRPRICSGCRRARRTVRLGQVVGGASLLSPLPAIGLHPCHAQTPMTRGPPLLARGHVVQLPPLVSPIPARSPSRLAAASVSAAAWIALATGRCAAFMKRIPMMRFPSSR
ncbi:MAG: hypothetical protein [Microviridae sp.]|nr:MAG: hypothetical protein [Microviridae sp.]